MALLSKRRRAQITGPPGTRLVLHVGCGPLDHTALHESFRGPGWHELRLDIDPGVRPDIVGSITDMSAVPESSVDAVYSQHNIEHVFAHEVAVAMGEFLRVLRPGGEVLLTTPDLQAVARAIASGQLEEALFRTEAGDISPLDIVYGLRSDIEGGREYMAHRTGFTARTLGRKLAQAGFVNVRMLIADYSLWARAEKPTG
jgi:SAM-dependent methyltransferase